MTPEQFLQAYQAALATQSWPSVDPLVHEAACVTFSNGTVHKGKEAVRSAYESNFSAIQNEEYRISNVHWVLRSSAVAVYLFDFEWTGRIADRAAGGSGRGSSVLVRDGAGWKLLLEHLGPRAAV